MQLVNKMAQVIAREGAAIGVNQLFAPVSDVARELRYGRVCWISLLYSKSLWTMQKLILLFPGWGMLFWRSISSWWNVVFVSHWPSSTKRVRHREAFPRLRSTRARSKYWSCSWWREGTPHNVRRFPYQIFQTAIFRSNIPSAGGCRPLNEQL